MALIKCPECGREISDKATACPGCGCPINQSVATTQQHEREADKPEIVLMQGFCNQVTRFGFSKNGSAILTNHRIVVNKNSTMKMVAIGILANLTRGSYDYEIPLGEIESIQDGKYGFSRTIVFNMKNGDRYELYFTKREEWKIKIESAMKAF